MIRIVLEGLRRQASALKEAAAELKKRLTGDGASIRKPGDCGGIG
jgi:translation initiation factor 1 (eIF-1/SUI1)